jgi:predicted 3-demethylubiquinone-9 3-methyltransferase (glyoxalase superfamily)
MTKHKPTATKSITPCLAFADRAEEAVTFYVSVFKDSRIVNIVRSDGGPVPKGTLLHATFELGGREYTAISGGPTFAFSQGISLVATVDSQAELDAVWGALTTEGKEGPCGWCTDKFGVSWQVVPRQLGEMMADPKGGDPGKLMGALVQMKKLDVAALEKAYRA